MPDPYSIFDDPHEPQTEAECAARRDAVLRWFNTISESREDTELSRAARKTKTMSKSGGGGGRPPADRLAPMTKDGGPVSTNTETATKKQTGLQKHLSKIASSARPAK